jgi:hypothetical protein
MLSTLSFNANGEVVGGSTKFKLCQSDNNATTTPTVESAKKDSQENRNLDRLKGDLQDLESRSAECRYLLSSKLKWPF